MSYDVFSGWRKVGVHLLTPLVVPMHRHSQTLVPSFYRWMSRLFLSVVSWLIEYLVKYERWSCGQKFGGPCGVNIFRGWPVSSEGIETWEGVGTGRDGSMVDSLFTLGNVYRMFVYVNRSSWDTLIVFRVFDILKSSDRISFVYFPTVVGQTEIV